MDFTIKEETNAGALNAIKEISDLCFKMAQNAVTILLVPILLLALLLLLTVQSIAFYIPTFIYNRKLKKYLSAIKEVEVKTESDYDNLKGLYIRIKEATQNQTSLNGLPKLFKVFFMSYATKLRLMEEIRKEVAEKLSLSPKGVTQKQIKESIKNNAEISDILEDEGGYDYAKALTLGKVKFIER